MSEEIAWSMADQYYKLINQKIERVNYFLTLNKYSYAFSELRQLYIMVKNEMAKKGNTITDELDKRILDLIPITNEYDLILLENPDTLAQRKKVQFTKLKHSLNEEIYYIFSNIINMLWELKIIAPRKFKDSRAPIHQTY